MRDGRATSHTTARRLLGGAAALPYLSSARSAGLRAVRSPGAPRRRLAAPDRALCRHRLFHLVADRRADSWRAPRARPARKSPTSKPSSTTPRPRSPPSLMCWWSGAARREGRPGDRRNARRRAGAGRRQRRSRTSRVGSNANSPRRSPPRSSQCAQRAQPFNHRRPHPRERTDRSRRPHRRRPRHAEAPPARRRPARSSPILPMTRAGSASRSSGSPPCSTPRPGRSGCRMRTRKLIWANRAYISAVEAADIEAVTGNNIELFGETKLDRSRADSRALTGRSHAVIGGAKRALDIYDVLLPDGSRRLRHRCHRARRRRRRN